MVCYLIAMLQCLVHSYSVRQTLEKMPATG
jgi:hypothetical protein